MSVSSISAAIVPSGPPKSIPATAVSAIQAAGAGGQALTNFVNAKNQIYYIGSGLQNQSMNWIQTTDKNGNPAYFAQVGTEADATYMSLAYTPVQAGETYSQIQDGIGNSYNLVGSLQTTYSSGGYGWLSTLLVGIAMGGVTPATLALAQAAVSAALRGVNTPLTSVRLGGQSEADVGAMDQQATEGVLSNDTILSLSKTYGMFLGLAGVITLTVLLEELLHYTQHTFTIYNLTNNDVTWTQQYAETGSEMTLGPIMNSGTSSAPNYVTDHVITGNHSVAPPGLEPVPAYGDAEFQFSTATEFTGLGYCFTLAFTDSSSGEAYTATFMFDLPFAGGNSMAATFSPVSSYESWYSQNEGANKVTQLSATSSDGKYKLTLAMDLLTGTQPGPGSLGTGYFYNSLVILESTSPTS